jgi:hypothetical protein
MFVHLKKKIEQCLCVNCNIQMIQWPAYVKPCLPKIKLNFLFFFEICRVLLHMYNHGDPANDAHICEVPP